MQKPQIGQTLLGGIIVSVVGGVVVLLIQQFLLEPLTVREGASRPVSTAPPVASPPKASPPVATAPEAAPPPMVATPPAPPPTPMKSADMVPALPVRTPLQQACPKPAIPTGPVTAAGLQVQICGIAACAGDGGISNSDVVMLDTWKRLAESTTRERCRGEDRSALTDITVVDRLHSAVDDIPIPAGEPNRSRCRDLKIAVNDSLQALGDRLRGMGASESNCPRGGPTPAVEEFMRTVGR